VEEGDGLEGLDKNMAYVGAGKQITEFEEISRSAVCLNICNLTNNKQLK